MSASTTIAELRNMAPADLRKEIASQENEVVKMRLLVKLGKQKDSALYVRGRKQLARMKTVLQMKNETKAIEDTEAPPVKAKRKIPASSVPLSTSVPSKKS